MPENAPAIKRARVLADGAEVVTVGNASAERQAVAERLAAERGLAMIPPYDDDRIIAGQGTCGLEIAEDLPDLAAVLVPDRRRRAGVGRGGRREGAPARRPGSSAWSRSWRPTRASRSPAARSSSGRRPTSRARSPTGRGRRRSASARSPTCGSLLDGIVTVTRGGDRGGGPDRGRGGPPRRRAVRRPLDRGPALPRPRGGRRGRGGPGRLRRLRAATWTRPATSPTSRRRSPRPDRRRGRRRRRVRRPSARAARAAGRQGVLDRLAPPGRPPPRGASRRRSRGGSRRRKPASPTPHMIAPASCWSSSGVGGHGRPVVM